VEKKFSKEKSMNCHSIRGHREGELTGPFVKEKRGGLPPKKKRTLKNNGDLKTAAITRKKENRMCSEGD